MKVLLISPFFPPLVNGLAHYSSNFAKELKKNGDDVTVCCSKGLGVEEEYPLYEMEFWNWNHFCDLFYFIKENNFDRALIQYVPHMYNRRGGINFSLSLFVVLLRLLTKTKIEIMFHELHYPLEPKIKSIFLWFVHHLMLFPVIWFSHFRFFSTSRYLRKVKRFSLNKKDFFLPVGSNIPRVSVSDLTNKTEGVTQLGFFGGPHPSKSFTQVFKGLEKTKGHFYLNFFGVEENEFINYFGDDYQKFNFKFHGTLSDKEVALQLSQLDFLIGYFTDGVSARRGSVLAALNNGVPIITTKSQYTEELFESLTGVSLLGLEDEFSNFLPSVLGKSESGNSQRIRDSFDQVFSWKKIIQSYAEFCR